MKKVSPNHLFIKLGWLISTCILSCPFANLTSSEEYISASPIFFTIDHPGKKADNSLTNNTLSSAYRAVQESKSTLTPLFFSFQDAGTEHAASDFENYQTDEIPTSNKATVPEPYYQVSVPNTPPQPDKTSSIVKNQNVAIIDTHKPLTGTQEITPKKTSASIREFSNRYIPKPEHEYQQSSEIPEQNLQSSPQKESLILAPSQFPRSPAIESPSATPDESLDEIDPTATKPSQTIERTIPQRKVDVPQQNRDQLIKSAETKIYTTAQAAPSIPQPQPTPESNQQSPLRTPQEERVTQTSSKSGADGKKTILINFNNVSIIEFIRFISRVSNKNFVFDEGDLQFNVTIVSEEPTTIDNIMTALLQELRIHDLTLIEQGNNLIIHKNPKVNSVSKVVADDIPEFQPISAEIVTQVFRLNTLEPDRAIAVIRPLVSENAILEYVRDTNHLIVTDLHSNVQEIGKLLKSLDAPNSGLVIGQYVAKTADINQLVPLAQQIMSPISKDNPLVFVPYENSNSIFIVSSPFLVERSISILQHLDQEKGKTRIINLQELQLESQQGLPSTASSQTTPKKKKDKSRQEQKPSARTATYQEEVRPSDAWDYGPSTTFIRPSETEEKGEETNILPFFIPVEIPTISIEKERELDEARRALEELQALQYSQKERQAPAPWHVGVTEFEPEEAILPQTIRRNIPLNPDYVPVPVNLAKFYIHKLQYRRGDVVLAQLQQIGSSLQFTKGNDELIEAINTVQWLQDVKSLVITGTPLYLEKVRELVEQIDIPLRQVYIEMLILDTTVDDSLNFAVNWASRFGGGNQAGSQGFTSGASPLQGAMDSTGVTGLGGSRPNISPNVDPNTLLPFNDRKVPDPRTLAKQAGFSLGVIGQNIIHKGLGIEFNSIGALVTALHTRNISNIILNPKIITEDNVPAQIFVGITTPFKTQSVSNDQGSIITNNFEYRDVGTSLQVTPHLHNSDLITLDIFEERSSLASTPASTGNSNTVIGPTTSKNSTKTTVHVPNGFFVIISGMIEDNIDRNRQQVPCLGSAPLIGGAFSDKGTRDAKRNLMIFIRPLIIDTDEEYQNLTRHQQDVWEFKNDMPKAWVQETEQALDFFNVRSTMNTDDEDLPPCHQFAH